MLHIKKEVARRKVAIDLVGKVRGLTPEQGDEMTAFLTRSRFGRCRRDPLDSGKPEIGSQAESQAVYPAFEI